jgi:hypothetical protein
MSMVQKAIRRGFPARPLKPSPTDTESISEKPPAPRPNEIHPPSSKNPPLEDSSLEDRPLIDPSWLTFQAR